MNIDHTRRQRIRSVLLVFSALLLFLAGLFLLFAPASNGQSRRRPESFRALRVRVDNGTAIAIAEFIAGGYLWSG